MVVIMVLDDAYLDAEFTEIITATEDETEAETWSVKPLKVSVNDKLFIGNTVLVVEER